MPILTVETDLYPQNLLSELPCSHSGRLWWVLHARPRQEKCIARLLARHCIPFFLPLLPRSTMVRGRVVVSHCPLFAGYVFMLANAQERLVALRAGPVVTALNVLDQERLWTDLRQVRRLIASGAIITPVDRLLGGVQVEVCSAPWTGLRGTLADAGRCLVVELGLIQRGASIDVDDSMVIRPV